MKFAIASFTRNGAALSNSIQKHLISIGHFSEAYSTKKYAPDYELKSFQNNISKWTELKFRISDCIIFVGASGIAVRTIAPLIIDKTKDPAVLVIDDNARFVISLLSGHIGGANKITQMLADYLKAIPVITTASDINHKFAVDNWAVENDLAILNINEVKHITSAILDGQTVGLASDFEIEGTIPEQLKIAEHEKIGICISFDENKKPFERTLNLIPKIISIGIGCRKNCPLESIEKTMLSCLEKDHISLKAVKNIASIDLKKDEIGLLEFSDKYGIDLITYSSLDLSQAKGSFTASEFVSSITGVDNVCERAASLASGSGKIIMKKSIGQGVTTAIAQSNWRVKF